MILVAINCIFVQMADNVIQMGNNVNILMGHNPLEHKSSLEQIIKLNDLFILHV